MAVTRANERLDETAPRRWPVRLIMVGIVFALVLPGLLFCGVLIQQIATTERTRSLEGAQATAERTADTLDREVSNLTAALVALGTSPALDTGDIAAFDSQARAVSATLGFGIVLADVSGQQIVNTAAPAGEKLPSMGSAETVRRVIETETPSVSGLFLSRVNQAPSLAIGVPVKRDGSLRYVLAINVRPNGIYEILRQQNLPKSWVATVVDADHRIIARTVDSTRFVGQPAPDEFRIHAAEDRAEWVGTTLEGSSVLVAMQRQRLADWRVGVGVPLSVVEAPLRRTVTLLAVAGLTTLMMACLLAWFLAGSVATPLQRLARAGDALVHGLPVRGVRSSIAEVDAVSRALVQATQDLRSRADALAAERAQLAAVIETVPVGLVIAEGPHGRIITGNSEVERMLRHPIRRSETTADYGEWTAFHADGQPVQAHEFPLARVLHGEPHAELQCLYQCGDGTKLWIDIVGAPIHDADGVLTGGIIALLDIDEAVRAREAKARFADHLESQVADRTTALRDANQRLRDEMDAREAAEEQLRQAQKMEAVGQLTGGIAHDFNNLLTIVMGSLDLLRRRAADDRTIRLLDNALEGTTRAATLTARLLAFSRRQPLMPQPLDANQLVGGMSDLLHRTLGESIEVETVLADDLWQVLTDPNQLENALLNLAVNARDAMLSTPTGGGVLRIETANIALGRSFTAANPDVPPGDYVQLSVSDTGAGMTPDVASHAFEPFFTTKPLGQGTGLGLSQVHGFVKQSGGHVAIRTAPGEGTTVTIYLPRIELDAPLHQEPVNLDEAMRPAGLEPATKPL